MVLLLSRCCSGAAQVLLRDAYYQISLPERHFVATGKAVQNVPETLRGASAIFLMWGLCGWQEAVGGGREVRDLGALRQQWLDWAGLSLC